MRDPDGFGTYPHPRLAPRTRPGGGVTFRCADCQTNGSPSHVPGSEVCVAIARMRWSRG